MLAAPLLLASPARGQPNGSLQEVLSVHPGGDGCLSEAALRGRVQRWLAPGSTLERGVTVVVDAAANPPSFVVERGGAVVAQRSFAVVPSACADRLDALALALALALEREAGATLNPDATAAPAGAPKGGAGADAGAPDALAPAGPSASDGVQPAPQAQQPAAAATAPAKPKPPPAPKPAAARTRAAPAPHAAAAAAPARVYRWRLQAGAGYWLETLPAAAVVGSLGVERQLGARASVALSALGTPPTTSSRGGVAAQSALLGGRALACLGFTLGELELGGCAGAAGGVVLAAGRADSGNRNSGAGWLAGVARAALRFPAHGRLSLRLAADGLANALRPRLVVTGVDPHTATVRPLGGGGSLELLFALP